MKNIKRYIALFMSLTLIILSTACSKDEIAYLNIVKKISTMDGTATKGNFSLNVTLPEGNSNSMLPMWLFGYPIIGAVNSGSNPVEDKIIEMLSDLSVSYDYQMLKSEGKARGTFTDAKTGDKLLEFILGDGELYVDVSYFIKLFDEMIALDYTSADTVGNSIKKDTLNRHKSLKYIKVTPQDLISLDSYELEREWFETDEEYEDAVDFQKEMAEEQLKTYEELFSLKAVTEQSKTMSTFIDEVLLKGYSGFESKIMAYDKNKYQMTLNTDNALTLIENAAIYSLDNIDDIAAGIKRYINIMPFSTSNLSWYDSEEQYKQEIRDMIDSAVKDIKENRESYKSAIKEALNPNNVGIITIKATLDGSEISTGLSDENSTISGSTDVSLNVKTSSFSQETLKVRLKESYTSTEITSLDTTAPDSDETFEISRLMDDDNVPMAMVIERYNYSWMGIEPYPLPMISPAAVTEEATEDVDEEADGDEADGNEAITPIDEDTTFFDSAVIDYHKGFNTTYDYFEVKEIDGKTYVPMDKLAQFFDEKIAWDNANAQPYVERDGKKIFLGGHIGNDSYEDEKKYIMAEDMKLLGYTVYLEDDGYIIIIIKK